MIYISNLRFSYGADGFGLGIEELHVPSGEKICWVGPSGSGKTTLLHLVAGIFLPDAGRVDCCGKELTSLSDAARRDFRIANIGLVFQDFALLDYLSVVDNILLPYRINSSLRLDESARLRASELASQVGLGSMLSRLPSQLSQGERQRVAACRALIAKPQLLLADEPTANLDASNAARVLDLLDKYATEESATCVIVSHDSEVTTRFEKKTEFSEFRMGVQPQLGGSGGHA